jgi:hypothetical protein
LEDRSKLLERVAGLSDEQRADLMRRLVHRAQGKPDEVPRVSRTTEIPLSYAQERLWLTAQMAPESPAYHLPSALRLRGRLDPEALRRAVEQVLRRHEALRTRFPTVEGRPRQVVDPPPAWALPVEDLSGLGPAGRRTAAAAARVVATAPFDLAAGPLLRTRLLRLGEDDHLLLACLHHIVADGWSIVVLARELAALYPVVAGGPCPLPELPVQYADFAAWQRDRLASPAAAAALDAWRRRLDGVPPLRLPTDRPRPAAPSGRGGRVRFAVPARLHDALAVLARRHDATVFMVTLAAFQALLGRLAAQDDFAVGTPAAGRGRPELEGLIGFFVNTLAVRAELGGDPTFAELLGRVRAAVLAALTEQEVPLQRLLEALGRGRDPGGRPLFQVMFALQERPEAAEAAGLRLPGLSLDLRALGTATAKYELTLQLTGDGTGGLRGELEYDADLFDAATARRLAGQYRRALAAAAQTPQQPIATLPPASPRERRRVRGWGAATLCDRASNSA